VANQIYFKDLDWEKATVQENLLPIENYLWCYTSVRELDSMAGPGLFLSCFLLT